MNSNKYLERIGIKNRVDLSIETLKLIHRQHQYTVPFENLDIHTRSSLNTNVDSLYNKIVVNKRGGICYELNGLLYHLLSDLGYSVKMIGAKVDQEKGSCFDHLLLIVNLNDNEYLVDVGFGNHFLEPLPFKLGCVQKDLNGQFKLVKSSNGCSLLRFNEESSKYNTAYTFSKQERTMEEFRNRMEYFISDEHSQFRRNLICSLERKNGRISLKQNRLKLSEKSTVNIQDIQSIEEFEILLKNYFNINISNEEQSSLYSWWNC